MRFIGELKKRIPSRCGRPGCIGRNVECNSCGEGNAISAAVEGGSRRLRTKLLSLMEVTPKTLRKDKSLCCVDVPSPYVPETCTRRYFLLPLPWSQAAYHPEECLTGDVTSRFRMNRCIWWTLSTPSIVRTIPTNCRHSQTWDPVQMEKNRELWNKISSIHENGNNIREYHAFFVNSPETEALIPQKWFVWSARLPDSKFCTN